MLRGLATATIHVPKTIPEIVGNGKDKQINQKLTGSTELTLFQESDIIMFKSLIIDELVALYPEKLKREEQKPVQQMHSQVVDENQTKLPLEEAEIVQETKEG